jgi:hypothetical protein
VGVSDKDNQSSAISQSDSKDNFVNPFYLKPMVGNDLLEKSEHDVEIVKWMGDSTDVKINKMILRPIESGNMVELYSGKEIRMVITSGTLHSVKVVEETKKSFMRKKQDLLLELSFYTNQQQKQQQNLSSILLNVEDKDVPVIMQYTQGIKEIEAKNYWSNVYGLPFLLEGESLIWSDLQTEGMINKRAIWLDVATNYRIFQYSMKNHGANYVAFGALEDVVVMNQKRVSQSSGYASYGRSKYHIAGTGGSRSTGMTIGDVVFVSQGRPFITFSQVQDPRGLAKLIKSISR